MAPKKFDTKREPKKPRPYLMPVEWGGAWPMTMMAKAKINKINFEGLKPPYLILCNHASFIDFPLVVRAIFPHRCSWVISIEEFIGREWLLRGIGGIYKRKFTQDMTVVRHILKVLTRDKVCCTIYPEARFSLAGINEQIDGALGKLAKKARCPVVLNISRGNFLRSPQWRKRPYIKVPIESDFIQIVTREEVAKLSAAEIQKRIEDAFVYDDYAWQKENNIRITSPVRAQNIHKILYQCPVCGTEFSTDSQGTHIWCNHCGASWMMNELGELKRENGKDVFTHVPDWYRWERENVRREIEEGRYHFEDEARLERLVNGRIGFKTVGHVKLIHDENGFTMKGRLPAGQSFEFNRTVASMRSVHIEYDYKHRGDAIDLCTLEDTYFVFPLTAKNCLTKLHFATEELYFWDKAKKEAEHGSQEGNPEETKSEPDTGKTAQNQALMQS